MSNRGEAIAKRQSARRVRRRAVGVDPDPSAVVALIIAGIAAAGTFLNGTVNLLNRIDARNAAKNATLNKLTAWGHEVKRLGQHIAAFDEFLHRVNATGTKPTPVIGTILTLERSDLRLFRDFVTNLCRTCERLEARSLELVQHFEAKEETSYRTARAIYVETERLGVAIKAAANDFNAAYPALWETRDLSKFMEQARALAGQLTKVEEHLAAAVEALR